jgi:hypothetical protein
MVPSICNYSHIKPRSGATFVYRLLARDEQQFFCFKTWEIPFPAIIQKKAVYLLGRFDRVLMRAGLRCTVEGVEQKMVKNFNVMHRTSLFFPEEDKLLLHIFATL